MLEPLFQKLSRHTQTHLIQLQNCPEGISRTLTSDSLRKVIRWLCMSFHWMNGLLAQLTVPNATDFPGVHWEHMKRAP